MSEYLIPEVGIVQAGQGFTKAGRFYNGKWLAGASEQDKAALGAVPVNRQPRPAFDPRIERLQETQDGATITYQVIAIDPAIITERLEAAIAAAKVAVDIAAEEARARFITPGSGQAMVYQAKTAEAVRWLANASPADLTGYPFIAAEVGITAATAADLVQLWQAMEAGWTEAAAMIEAARMAGKTAIDQAEDFDAVDIARNQAMNLLAAIVPPEDNAPEE